MEKADEGAEEVKKDEKVGRRLQSIATALKKEEDWRKDAKKTFADYRSSKSGHSQSIAFNILWANVEIKRFNLYGGTPSPDVRRRYNDKDPVGKAVAEVLNRGISYTLDCQDFDGHMIDAVNDMLLPSRGNIRVRYLPYNADPEDAEETEEGEEVEQELVYEEAVPETVDWDKLILGPGNKWRKKPWIAFEHELTKTEIKNRFPDIDPEELSYDVREEEGKIDGENGPIPKAIIYEQWDKKEKKVYWLGKGYTDKALDIVDDPLDLKDFYPIPPPLYAIEDPDSTVPIIEYFQYLDLAEELDEVTKRRRALIKMIRAVGCFDASLAELETMFSSSEGDLVPLENASKWQDSGGIDKAIWFAPIEQMVNTYRVLGEQRQHLVAQIYELTGISDIVRGDTNPNETLGAQEMKATFASARFEKQKNAVEKYSRNVIRLLAEIICGFSRDTLSLMTGLDYPTQEEQQQAQMAMQQIQQQAQMQIQQMQQQQMPPEQIEQAKQQIQQQSQQQMAQYQEVLSEVTWEQIEEVLQSDISREYKVDIETDATIEVNKQKDQASMTAFMNGMGQFIGFAGDGMSTGLLSQSAAKKMLIAFSRKFKMGQDVEDELEEEIPQRPDPNAQKIEMEQKMEQQRFQMEMQAKQQDMQFEQAKQQMEMQSEQTKQQMDMQKAQFDMQIEQQRLQNEQQKAEIDKMLMLLKAQTQEQTLQNKAAYDEQQHENKMEALNASTQRDNG